MTVAESPQPEKPWVSSQVAHQQGDRLLKLPANESCPDRFEDDTTAGS